MTTCSCRMWLCLTLARIANGAVALPRLRNTAVPGTRCTGGRRACSSSTNARSEALVMCASLGDHRPAALPRGQHGEHGDRDEQRNPRPVQDLGGVRGQEQHLDGQERAGVIMLSPKNSDAPKIPNAARASLVRRPPRTPRRRIRVISARMPPSPSLSARITSSTYLIVTMIVTDQKISEMTPYTLSVVAGTGCGSSGLKTVCTV